MAEASLTLGTVKAVNADKTVSVETVPGVAPARMRTIGSVAVGAQVFVLQAGKSFLALPAEAAAGVTDHGQLTGLSDPDHPISAVQGLQAALVAAAPVGAMYAWPAASAPTGWLLCDGSAVSTTTYAALYALLGTTYNIGGESAGTFRVPNLKGRAPVGYDSSQTEFNTRGKTGGAKTHALSLGEFPAHTHAQVAHSHALTRQAVSWPAGAGGLPEAAWQGWNLGPTTVQGVNGTNVDGATTTGSAGTGGAHNNLQPYLVLNFIIKT